MKNETAERVGLIVLLLGAAGGGYWYYYNSHDRVASRAMEATERLKHDLDRLEARTQATDAPAASEESSPTQTAPAPVMHPVESTWQFHEVTDSFSNRKFQYATVKSLNTLKFGYPYQGEQHATLRYEPSFYAKSFHSYMQLFVERGQFSCSGEYCHVLVKFDDGSIRGWAGSFPNDGSRNVLQGLSDIYVDDECFALKMQRVKSITIRAEFYREGMRDMEFNVAGLRDLPLPTPDQSTLRKCRLPKAAGKPTQG